MKIKNEIKEKTSKKGSFVTLIFLILAMGFFLVSVLPSSLVLKYVGIKPFVIVSNSMKGKLEVGDVVIVQSVPASKLNKWDIITFYRETNDGKKVLVTHYLAEINYEQGGYAFKTKSNVATALDNWVVLEEDYVGKAILKIPYLGQAALAMRNPLILLNTITIVFLMYTGFYLISSSSEDAEEENINKIN